MPAILIDPDACDLCGLCDIECENHALSLVRWYFEYIPSLCEACAWCVDACPSGALQVVDGPWWEERLLDAGWHPTLSENDPSFWIDVRDEGERRKAAFRDAALEEVGAHGRVITSVRRGIRSRRTRPFLT